MPGLAKRFPEELSELTNKIIAFEMLYYWHMGNKSLDKARLELGNKLKQARKKAKLTQATLAVAAGVNTNYYARIERGEENPSFEKLNKIMKALGIKSLDVS